MLRDCSFMAITYAVVGAALLSVGALAQTDIGLLPFRAQPPEAYYAHVVVEDLRDDATGGGGQEPSHRRAFCKGSDSPGTASCYYPDTGDPAWLPADVQVPSVLYEQPALPAMPLDLFYTNYEVRVHGVDEVAGRSCFLVSVISRASGHPAMDLCVDRATGLSLRLVNYDFYGNAIYRVTYLEFDTEPDLSGIEFPEPTWTIMQIPSTDLTADELTNMLPWLRLPTWLPGNFQLLAIQHWHAQSEFWRDKVRVQIVYTDGLRNINITAMAPMGATKLPERSNFSQSPGGPNSLPSISAIGPYVLAASDTDRFSDEDLYRVLWSMLPWEPDDVSPAAETKPKPPGVVGGHHDAL